MRAVLISLIAGMATGLGALAIFVFRRSNMRFYDALMGFCGGIMLALSIVGLVQEALRQGGALVAIAGYLLGAGLLFGLDLLIPHIHSRMMDVKADGGAGRPVDTMRAMSLRKGVLISAAIALHNLPEGFVVGVTCAAQPALGLFIAAAIALHNIPEGIVVAAPLYAGGMSKVRSVLWAALSGLTEPLGAIIGVILVANVENIVPLAMAFAGGAMFYVVFDEIIPESHSHGYEHEATWGLIGGFIMMMVLNNLIAH